MQDSDTQQQVIDRIKNASNILVTVSRNPSVDALTALLALTLMLNKLDKRATAVFSGVTPPAITFLKPGATFESTVNSLRDFIIALDKEKADRLRYKVEDDVVRVFITPYKTTITQKDLQFSQGDFNVDLVVALGAGNKQDLDTAITAHGRILHDAAVMSINVGNGKSDVGDVNWSDASASCLSEMVMNIGEALQPDVLDEQIATALLTGIVAATNRFSNTNTRPSVMTLAARLMAAGANQQLIAAKLEEGHAVSTGSGAPNKPKDKQVPKDTLSQPATPPAQSGSNGDMRIAHDLSAQPAPVAPDPAEAVKDLAAIESNSSKAVKAPQSAESEPITDSPDTAAQEEALAQSLPQAAAPTLNASDLYKDIEAASQKLNQDADAAITAPTQDVFASSPAPAVVPAATHSSDWRSKAIEPPMMGGTLNATTEDAEEAKREEEQSDRNRTILSHDTRPAAVPIAPLEGGYAPVAPTSLAAQPNVAPVPDSPAAEAPKSFTPPPAPVELAFEPTPPAAAPVPVEAAHDAPTLAEIDQQARSHPEASEPISGDLASAREAVEAALSGMSLPAEESTAQSQPNTLQLDDAAPITMPETIIPTEQSEPAIPAFNEHDGIPALPPLPPMPDFSTLPPLPQAPQPTAAPAPVATASAVASNDPAQFRIPGQ